MTADEARRILEQAGLPSDMDVHIVDSNRFDGRYLPASDRLELRPQAGRFTVLHEGSHAEHYGKLALRGDLSPWPLPLEVGILLGSEL